MILILIRRLNTAAQRIQRQGDLSESDVISHWRERMLVVHCSNAFQQGMSASGILSYEGIRGEDDGDDIDSCDCRARRGGRGSHH
jgi:hypothetical protein